MKNIFLTIKKKVLVCILCGILITVAIFVCAGISKATATPASQFSIVIDAGHGGLDVK